MTTYNIESKQVIISSSGLQGPSVASVTANTKTVEVYQDTNSLDINLVPNVINISEVSIQGPKGDVGAAGASGTNGINAGNFTFEQQSDSASWVVTHNLGYRPAVIVQDYGKITIEGELNYIDANSLNITFSASISGYAYLS